MTLPFDAKIGVFQDVIQKI